MSMIRIGLIIALFLSVTTVATVAIKAVYQAGWDAREMIAVQENAQRQRALAEALLRSSDKLAFEFGKTVSAKEALDEKLKEIENGQPEDPSMCGVSLERMRLLDEIR